MDSLTSLAISSSALHAQRLRMDVIAANLANAQSTRTPEGGPYKRHDVVLEATPGGSFGDILGSEVGGAVRVARVAEDTKPPRIVFDPATRAYEANVAAVNATKRVLEAALSIGR